ncbi:MAG TPA: hypothetical protein VFR74_09965 [Jiangellales bacterium]|nr:hypothetical protein [Jiangellales bacterium]
MSNTPKSSGTTQSDLAFFGKHAVAGNYTGFRILDVSSPVNPGSSRTSSATVPRATLP